VLGGDAALCLNYTESGHLLCVVEVDTTATGGTFSAEQTVYILYIALAGADLILLLLSIVMLFGVEPVICIKNLFYS